MTCDILATLHSPADVQRLDDRQLDECCAQIRETLVEFGKRAGGHIGSNLGLVETSVALHAALPRNATWWPPLAPCRRHAT